MAFVPTTWVDGSAPAITAAQMNRIETGIDEAHSGDVDFLGNNTVAIYVGRLASDGSATSLPSGWSSSRTGTVNNYTYVITHNLTTTNVGAVVTAINDRRPQSSPSSASAVSIRLGDGAGNFVNDAFSFVLFRYS